MINYDELNEAVKEIVDNLTSKYMHDIKEFPLIWVVYAFNRAMADYNRSKLDEDIRDYIDNDIDTIKEVCEMEGKR